jgi:hypothetical protein
MRFQLTIMGNLSILWMQKAIRLNCGSLVDYKLLSF